LNDDLPWKKPQDIREKADPLAKQVMKNEISRQRSKKRAKKEARPTERGQPELHPVQNMKPPNDPKILYLYTVYDHPKDYPNHFVARRFEVSGDAAGATSDMQLFDSLEEVRKLFQSWGLFCLGRSRMDEPQIVETWV
jgi:hypothetical protein